ncbi:MAG: VacJ family lipoprotein, partial [Desulfuromonadales bacterium]|nr:VacJ family lipoprotein [Desulfuromonadales bacterium]
MSKFINRLSPGVAIILGLIVFRLLFATPVMAENDDFFDDEFENDELVLDSSLNNAGIADPIEPLNRVFFTFNDKLYFWVLKPVATGYKAVFADEDVRGCFANAFHNLLAPVRVVNNILQGKIGGAGSEVASFLINSTLGIAGLADPAHHEFGLSASDEDFGQTLGYYGIGNGFYICWPILGPSSLRDTVGRAGDALLDPLTWVTADEETVGYALQGEKQLNKISLNMGDYEQFIEASFDPYTAVRNAYVQHRD